MELFDKRISNLLPYDGVAEYFGQVLDDGKSIYYFKRLLNNIEWRHDEVEIFGKRIITKRMTAWYGDKNYAYTYSRITRHALLWTEELMHLKLIVEEISGASYNSCLLNLYHDGEEGMAWHSDNEDTLVENAAIASVSLGADRKFSFRHKRTKETVSVMLENGSILVMKGETQNNWLHALPKSKKVGQARINLTFRMMKA